MGFQAGAYRSVLRSFSFGDGGAWRKGRLPGDLTDFLVTRILGKNADKKLGRERRHVSGEG